MFERNALHQLSHLFSLGVPVQQERDNQYIHISKITRCAKRLWKQTHEENDSPPVATIQQLVGIGLHGMIENLIEEIMGNSVETEVPVNFLPSYPVIGTADIVDRLHVIDLKFLGDYGFQNWLKYGIEAYKIQVLLYAKALNRPFATLFVVNRKDLSYKVQIYIVKNHENTLDDYLKRAKWIMEETECPPPYDTVKYECKYCPYYTECWRQSDVTLSYP